MDATANLAEQIDIARRIYEQGDFDDAERLAELVLELNQWLHDGGSLPSPWHARR